MKKKPTYPFVILLLCLLGLYSCANVMPLTGGDKDTAPPKIKETTPAERSTRITPKKITIEFDEFVVLKDASKQILISPPGTDFIALEKGKSIDLTITDTLRTNTTYVINFGNAIADNNEGNVLQGYVFTFSTGDIIDSLKTKFLLLDAYTLKPIEKARILLYENNIDTLPYSTMPYYAGLADESGKTTVPYMKAGKFKVFALVEANNNYFFDHGSETIGFTDSLVTAGDSNTCIVYLFSPSPKSPVIKTSRMHKPGAVSFKFNGQVDKTMFALLNKNYRFDTAKFEFMGELKDSAVYWFKPINKTDTLVFTFNNGITTDTLKSFVRGIGAGGGGRNNKPATGNNGSSGLKLTKPVPGEVAYFKPLLLEFNAPLDSLGGIQFMEEGKSIVPDIKPYDATGRKYVLQYAFKQGKNYVLYFPKKSIKDISGNYIDSVAYSFKATTEKMYKNLQLIIKNPGTTQGGGILQLLGKDDEILEVKYTTWADSSQVTFSRLPAGSYRVKLMYDTNHNGKWDTGDYTGHIQPEKVVFFPQSIEVKPPFDVQIEWDILRTPVGGSGNNSSSAGSGSNTNTGAGNGTGGRGGK